MVAVIVDLNGVRLALLRGDGSPIHSMDNAYYKAYSAASLTLGRNEDSLRVVAERMKKNPPSTLPQTQLPNVSYALGGIAIKSKGQIIGGLGVSGAPGGQFDEECGNAALDKIKRSTDVAQVRNFSSVPFVLSTSGRHREARTVSSVRG